MKPTGYRTVKRVMVAIMCALALLATGCSGNGVPLREVAEVTLPPANNPNVAPIGDAALEYTALATLYLPRLDGTHLLAITDTVPLSVARPNAESIVRALLSATGNGAAQSIAGDVKLSLYGSNPVEISGNVATVNLAASALQLDHKALYISAQAIANTLTEVEPIRYVNVLVMDKQIGLDIASTLPGGTLTRNAAGDIGAVFDQVLSQRVEAGQNPDERKMATIATLYFPIASVNGVMAEAQNMSFPGQSTETVVLYLLQKLSEGPTTLAGALPLPVLEPLLTEPPALVEPSDGGERVIELHFQRELWTALEGAQVSRVNFMASLCNTLCTFMPNVTGVTLFVGEERIDHVMYGATNGLLFDDGIQRRANFAPFLLDTCTLYFPNSDATSLVAVHRPVPYYQRTNPRALLLALFAGPSPADDKLQTQALLPSGSMTDADILGISLSEEALLVNFSQKFQQAGQTLTSAQDRLLAYGLTNTLLCGDRTRKISFFVAGKPFDGFGGEMDWTGFFYPNPGMASQTEVESVSP